MKSKMLFTVSIVFLSTINLNAQVDRIAKMMEGYDMPENYKGSIAERYLISKETNLTFKLNIYLPITYNESKN